MAIVELQVAVDNANRPMRNSSQHRALVWVRRGWLVLAAFLFVIFIISIPGAYRMMQTLCASDGSDCASWAQPTPEAAAQIEQSGISLQGSALYLVGLYTSVSLVFWVVGMLIYHYRRDQWFALLVAHLLVIMGTGGASMVFASGQDFTALPLVINIVVGLLALSMYQLMSIFLLSFPNGRLYGRWNFIPFVLICLNTLVWLAPPPINIEFWPETISNAWLALVFGSHLVVQVIRYRKMYTPAERKQTKWLIYGFSVPILMFVGFGVLTGTRLIDPATVHPLVDHSLVVVIYLPIGLAIGIAILRYQLWDIDVIINRTLVYGVLTAILIGVYALIVGAVSLLVHDDRNFLVSLLGAGVIAVSFQPLRETVQRAINRLMFGQRDDPLRVLDALGKRLEAALSQEAALTHLVESTAQSLKLPFMALEREDGSTVASSGRRIGEPERFPLIYEAQIIGALLAAPRSRAETLNAADRLVLENVARQASNLLHASRLTADLQQSRQQIVTAREEERRRLRRDLHDGLGPALATLTLQAEAARDWVRTDPARSETLLAAVIEGTQSALADIRRVVYALRPPVLDDLGLISAIKDQASQFTSGQLSITVDVPENLPPLPAAVEVAAYRIVQEALTNVSRHATARTCTVSLSVNGTMVIDICDDGVGMVVPYRAGVGLNSIHERAAELGGFCVIESKPGEGTQVRVSLPRA